MVKLSDYEKEHRKAVKSLDKYVKENFTEEEQDDMAWHTDEVTDTHYIWRYDVDGKTTELNSCIETGAISVVKYGYALKDINDV